MANRAIRTLWALSLCVVGVMPAWAERLDDSASPRARVQATIEATGAAAGSPYVWATFRGVEYRLATGAYVGRRARISLVVPMLIDGLRSPAGLRLEWRGAGAFASGAAGPGERRVVWVGTVPAPWMVERLDLRMQLDLREWRATSLRALNVETYFEIEVMP